MQRAIALSPSNKAILRIEDKQTIITVQQVLLSVEASWYHLWIMGDGASIEQDFTSDEFDAIRKQFGVNPNADSRRSL